MEPNNPLIVCRDCGEPKFWGTGYRHYSEKPSGRPKRCIECENKQARLSRKKYNDSHPNVTKRLRGLKRRRDRQKVIDKLGGKCVKCGFDDFRALQIDHVNGGGKRELRGMVHFSYLKKVLNDTTGAYQLLCANCNWIKRFENNEQNSTIPWD
jgi:hypothetical protein